MDREKVLLVHQSVSEFLNGLGSAWLPERSEEDEENRKE